MTLTAQHSSDDIMTGLETCAPFKKPCFVMALKILTPRILDVGKVVMIEFETSAQLKRLLIIVMVSSSLYYIHHNVCKIVSYCHHEAIQFIAWPS